MTDQTEAERRLEELKATSTKADADTEELLVHLEEIQARRRKDPALEREYEDLRATLVARLKEGGPRYYLDNMGLKKYAYLVEPEPVEIDVAALCALDEEGKLKAGVLDAVAPRKADKEAFRRAVGRGDITREQFLATAKVTKGTPYVRHSDPVDAE
jgi:hypothetical protein